MTIRRPTQDQLAEIAADFGFCIIPAEIAAYADAAVPGVQLYEAVDAMSDNLAPVGYPRTPGYRPEGEENKYNAWHVKVRIDGKAGAASSPVNGSCSRTAFVGWRSDDEWQHRP